MRKIELTQGQVALVDDEDFDYVYQWNWYAHKDGNTFYVARAGGRVNGSMTTITMHRVILGVPSEGFVTDHVDGNGCNNQRSNLRFVTYRQNAQNRSKMFKTSKYHGVYWNRQAGKWMAKIYMNNKNKHLGYFTSELQAFYTYKKAVEALGETVLEIN